MEDKVLTTKEACKYLQISKPTYLNLVRNKKIRAAKAGKNWRVLRSELDRFLRGETIKEESPISEGRQDAS